MEENVRVFDDSLFCVHLQRQYSAARELEDFVKLNNVDIKNIQDPNLAKYFQALKVVILINCFVCVCVNFLVLLREAVTMKEN